MTTAELVEQIHLKKSFLCIGLDTDLEKIPSHLLKEEDPLFAFNKAIIDATHHLCVAYKPNIAFYEVLGSKGWDVLEQTVNHIPKDVFTIADAKRGDIGNTALMYAKTFFETYSFDSVTVNPYMGYDSVEPYLRYDDKATIVLGLTSNKGSEDFQELRIDDKNLAETVSAKISSWNNKDNCMLVVGATNSEKISRIRSESDNMYFLVPGIGAQGGSLEDVIQYAGKNVIINSSRSIIYASSDSTFGNRAKEETIKLKDAINVLIEKHCS